MSKRFASEAGFRKYFSDKEIHELQRIIDSYDNPEEINSSPEGAPSKRLLRIVQDYDKVVYGNIIALEIGLKIIIEKCPRFKAWTELLIEKCSELK